MSFRNKYFNKKIRSLSNQLLIPPFIDQHDYRNSIFLAGTGRSGTTWLQEILNYDNSYRIMFEPFYPEKVNIVSDWLPFQYLNTYKVDTKYLKPALDILSGNVRNRWVDKYNKRLFSKRRLIKDIRANLILYWIKDNFPEIPIVLIIRHPCAVANSKLQANWEDNLKYYVCQEALMEDFLNPFEREMRKLKSSFEKHIFSWCIENFIPLKQFHEGEMFITFYETLCVRPKSEINELFSFIGKNSTPKVLKRILKPSLETSKRSAIISGTDLISSWRKNISDVQIKKALDILSLFGLDEIYNDSNSPLVDAKNLLK